MKKEIVSIDKNAHIKNLVTDVAQINGKIVARISFSNICGTDITAIKFTAKGYNSFGDVVLVNGRETFLLIIQDIHIPSDGDASDLKAVLPASDIRTLELVENQVCLSDGSVLTYNGKDVFEAELEILDNELKRALHSLVDNRLLYIPQELSDNGWICGCGKYNFSANESCESCKIEKKYLFDVTSGDGRNQLVLKKKAIDAEKREKEKQDRKEREKRKKIVSISIGAAIILVLILSVPISHQIILSQRTTYSSVEEMKSAIQGTYTYYSDITGDASRQVIINGDKVTRMYQSDSIEDSDGTIVEYNPSEGTFEVSYGLGSYVVTKDGDLQEEDDDLYVKGGYMSKRSSSGSRRSYESAYTALDISNLNVYTSYSYTYCSGTITNNGKKSYSYVKVRGAFTDSIGNVLDTDWTYAVDSEELKPGESKKFELSVKSDEDIDDCNVTISTN